MFLVKLATAIVICGGVTRHDDSGIKSRGESHLLLIGDPGKNMPLAHFTLHSRTNKSVSYLAMV